MPTEKYRGFAAVYVVDSLSYLQALFNAAEFVLVNTTKTEVTIRIIGTVLLKTKPVKAILFMLLGVVYAPAVMIRTIQDTKITGAEE